FEAGFERSSDTAVLIRGALEDWGTTGTAFSSTVFSLDPLSVPVAAGDNALVDGTLWAGWRAFGEGGAAAIDNFSAVPEPATLLMLGLGGMFLARRKTRA